MDGAQLADALDRLPSQPLTTMRILRLVDDDATSAAQLGRLVEVDPALSARVLRLANSPFYGLGGKVANAEKAVILLGSSTVRALAASGAMALLAGNASMTPEGFWTHSLATGVAAAHIARLIDLAPQEAFTAGLLHDVGTAVFSLLRPDIDHQLDIRSEEELFGGTHAAAGALALEHWRFPASLVRAVNHHHEPAEEVVDQLTLVIQAAAGIAALVEPAQEEEPDPALPLAQLGLAAREIRRICERIGGELEELAGFVAQAT